MNKTTNAINNIFADSKVSAKFAEVTNRELIEQHINAEYGQKLKKLTVVSDDDYARIIQAAKQHFYRAATEYCGAHPDTNMITAMLFVMNQAEVNKVAERYVLGAAPVKGVKALFKGAKNMASKAYETAFPDRNFDTDMREFAEDLKESGREVGEELKEDFNKAKAAVQDLKKKHAAGDSEEEDGGDAEEDDSATTSADTVETVPAEEEPAPANEEQPVAEPDSKEKKEEIPAAEEEEEAGVPHCVRVVVMSVGESGEIPEIPEEAMKGLPDDVKDFLKELIQNGGKMPAEKKDEPSEE